MTRFHSHVTLAAMFALGSFHFPPEGVSATPANDPPAPNPTPSVQGLREEFSRLHTEAEGVVNAAVQGNRELTAEEKAANDRRFSRMTAIKNTIDEQQRFAGLSLPAASPTQTQNAGGRTQLPTDAPGRDAFNASEGRNPAPDPSDPFAVSDQDRALFSREVRRFAVDGELGPIAKRFATITTSTNGGILLPKQVTAPAVPTSINPFRAAHVFHNMPPVSTTTTAALTQGVLDATAGGIVAENASSETESGAVSEGLDLTPKTFQSGSTWYSNQQLRANDFDLLTVTVPQLRYNKELGLESAIAAALIADEDIDQEVEAASISTISYDNLVDLDMALPSRFDAMKAIVLSRAAFAAARKLVGDDGHPLLISDPQRGGLAFFNNTPVFRCDYLEAFDADNVIGVIFSLLGFKIRDVTTEELARYTNQPGRPNQTGLNLFAYHGYGWAPAAVAKLICPAS